jgi:hypothetical protein
VLERLMAAASIEVPISLVVRPFHGAPCPPPAADPVARSEAASASPTSPSPSVCLSGFELPPPLRQGFFVPFVVSLQRQADPESDPERPSAAFEGRTILLNASGLELVRQVSPPGKRQQHEPAPVLPPEAICRIAEEFAAIRLGQPPQRAESFDRIHAQLAERISKIRGEPPKGSSALGWLFLPLVPFFAPYAITTYLDELPSRNRGDWINARLAESPHWQVLEQYAPVVATALKELRGLKEAEIIQTWGQIDGWFGVAAQERDEVIEEQRKQAQVEALRLLAPAGFDPRFCADVFRSASAALPDGALIEAYEQARRKKGSIPSRVCPVASCRPSRRW